MLHDRPKSHLQYFGRLYYQYIVDNYSKIELGRLKFIRFNQKKLRADLYQGLFDALNQYDTIDPNSIGKVHVLPSSFTGGPRNMTKLYQDAMAGVRVHGKPDLFLTITTNPNWPEIKNELIEGQTPKERSDLIARVFRLKLTTLMNDILNNQKLGETVAYVYVIEFQKRGLPHAHILIMLREQDKIITPDQSK
jgi:ATP-dependent DNA helicase PIF1